MRIIYVRHGETVGNLEKKIQGHFNGKLSPLGIKQAQDLANKLKSEKIDVAFSSDLDRAMITIKEILKFHPAVRVYYKPELRERYYGDLENTRPIGRKRKIFDEQKYNPSYRPSGGESTTELKERVESFLKFLLKKHKNDTILIVGHADYGKMLTGIISRIPIEKLKNVKRQQNAEIVIFEQTNFVI